MHTIEWKQNLGKRSGQEDRYFCETAELDDINISTIAVADGMGGHEAGEIAAELAIEAVASLHNKLLEKNEIDWQSIRAEMSTTIEFANQKIADYISVFPAKEGMGTTLTFTVVIGDELAIGHIGDSRAYLLAPDSIDQVTKDHTAIQDAIDRGVDISNINVGANALMHCLDGSDSLTYNVYPDYSISESIKCSNKCVLICSDGLYGVLNEQGIYNAFTESQDIKEASIALMNKVIEAGPLDNTTLTALAAGNYSLYKQREDDKKKPLHAKAVTTWFIVLIVIALTFFILKHLNTADISLSKNLGLIAGSPVFVLADSTEVKIIEPTADDTIARSDIDFKWEVLSESNDELDFYGLQIKTINDVDSVINVNTYTIDHREASVFSENRIITFTLDSSLFRRGVSYRWQPYKINSEGAHNLNGNGPISGYAFHIRQPDSTNYLPVNKQ